MLTQTYDGYMRMQRNEKWGYLDEMGREVIPAEYDFIKFLEKWTCTGTKRWQMVLHR